MLVLFYIVYGTLCVEIVLVCRNYICKLTHVISDLQGEKQDMGPAIIFLAQKSSPTVFISQSMNLAQPSHQYRSSILKVRVNWCMQFYWWVYLVGLVCNVGARQLSPVRSLHTAPLLSP